MRKQFIKITGYTWLAIILILVFLLVGCGGNNLAQSEEPTEEMVPTEEPTEEVIPTEEPTKEVIPTEEVVPTEDTSNLPQIMGKYSVSGLDPNYNNYEGKLEITASEGILLWNWLDRERDGLGVSQENVVSVGWLGGMGSCNVMSYTIQEDGVLDGLFIIHDNNELGNSKSYPTGEMGEGIEGTYGSNGRTPSLSWGGPLEITRNGDVYDFYWEFDWGEWYGVGIQRGNIVSIAFTHRKIIDCMLVSYLIEEDGTLDGIWAYVGDTELGADVAIPETSE